MNLKTNHWIFSIKHRKFNSSSERQILCQIKAQNETFRHFKGNLNFFDISKFRLGVLTSVSLYYGLIKTKFMFN